MTPAWEIVRTGALPGDDGQLLLLDREDGAGGRTVCIVPGHLEWRTADGGFVRLLDEEDIANAKIIAAAPRMQAVLQRLTEWASSMGGLGGSVLDRGTGGARVASDAGHANEARMLRKAPRQSREHRRGGELGRKRGERYRNPSSPAKGGSSPCSRAKGAVRVAPVPRRRRCRSAPLPGPPGRDRGRGS